MLEPIRYETEIEIKEIPIQWMPLFELYYPDLPQFPIVYIHLKKDGVRIYGFPVSVHFDIVEMKTCNARILFLSNINLDGAGNETLRKDVADELEERFGSKNRVSLGEIIRDCKGSREYGDLFKELWKHLSKIYGDYLPFGRYYDELFSIVRFVAAWAPKTGRQSEMRMLYNFLRLFGERIRVEGRFDFFDFFLIPTYDDMMNEDLDDFPKFKRLFSAMKKIWINSFTREDIIDGTTVHSMRKGHAWPTSKENFIRRVSNPSFYKKLLTLDEKQDLEGLVDAFNRHGWRGSYFVWSIMTALEKDYRKWDKDFFVKFYTAKLGVGFSPKVVACFLQQGFGNEEVIPIDTWVQAFYNHVLGIDTLEEFFNSFDNLGKIERAIWRASQAKKTNISAMFDILWCIRFGTHGNRNLRGANPISCYECGLRAACPSYKKIADTNVYLENAVNGRFTKRAVIGKADERNCHFICISEARVPKKIFMKKKKKWILIDEFSGYILKNQKLRRTGYATTVEKMIAQLPQYRGAGDLYEAISD